MFQNSMNSEKTIKNVSLHKSGEYELQAAFVKLFDIMFFAALICGAVALFLSFWRLPREVWTREVAAYAVMYLIVIAALLFRKHIPVRMLFYLLLLVLSADALYSLIARGLTDHGFVCLMFLCASTGIFIGLRAGTIAVICCFIGSSLIGIAVYSGFIPPKPLTVNRLSLSLAWGNQIIYFLMYTIPLIFSVNAMRRRMSSSLDELKMANKKLQSEIAAREEIANQLAQSEARYRNIFERSVEGIFQINQDGRLLNANPSLALMTGYASPEEMMRGCNGQIRFQFVSLRDLIPLKKNIDRVGFVENFESRMVRKDGSLIWVSVNARRINDGSAGAYYEGTIENITKRKNAEAALKESEALYRAVVENALTCSYIVQDGTYRFVNARFCEVSQYTYDEIVGKKGPQDFVHPEELQKVKDHLKNAENVAHSGMYELRSLSKDGRVHVLKIFETQFMYKSRPAIFGTFIDITKEKTLEAELRRSQRMEAMGVLTSGIAHDFNNIITALTGYGTILLQRMEQLSPLRHYADRILSVSRKAADLTKGLMDLGKRQPINLKPAKINAVVRGTEKPLRKLLTDGITLKMNLSTDDPMSFIDAPQLSQVLLNLVANSRDALPEGGLIYISTEIIQMGPEFITAQGFGEPGPYVRLSVSDTGFGMDQSIQEKIFDPFFTTKPSGQGTGLGLSAVYSIVKQHNAYIAVESCQGKGTVFHIYFPEITSIREHESAESNDPARQGSEKILVAEDNEDVRRFVREILSEQGYRVIDAVDGRDALAKFVKHKDISLVVIDSVMPNKNGREAYNEMKKSRPEIRALFMSGYTMDPILNEAILRGEIDFIPKPLSPSVFLGKVGEILDRVNQRSA